MKASSIGPWRSCFLRRVVSTGWRLGIGVGGRGGPGQAPGRVRGPEVRPIWLPDVVDLDELDVPRAVGAGAGNRHLDGVDREQRGRRRVERAPAGRHVERQRGDVPGDDLDGRIAQQPGPDRRPGPVLAEGVDRHPAHLVVLERVRDEVDAPEDPLAAGGGDAVEPPLDLFLASGW